MDGGASAAGQHRGPCRLGEHLFFFQKEKARQNSSRAHGPSPREIIRQATISHTHIMSTNLHTLFEELARSLSMDLSSPLEFPLQLKSGHIVVAIELEKHIPGSMVVHRSLGIIPLSRETEISRALLEANLFWSGTGDATIGVNSETREAVIAYRFDYREVKVEGLSTLIEQFTVLSEVWRKFIEEPGHDLSQRYRKA